jgi:hypothetical protein
LGDPLTSAQPSAQPQTTPASQDPEMVAGAAHQSELGKILHAIGGTLVGDKSYKATPQADGSIRVEPQHETTGEIWRRVAAEALGGAAKGLAVGQGPGGAARAASAGIQSGLDFQKNQLDQTNKEAEAQQKIMLNNAQLAALHIQVAKASFDQEHWSRDDLQAQNDRATKNMTELVKQGYEPMLMNATDPKTIAQYGIANPQAVGWHTGVNGDIIYNEPNGKGGVNFYRLSAEAAQRPTTQPTPVDIIKTDPKDATKTITDTFNIPAGTTNAEVAKQRMAITVANSNVSKGAHEALIAQQNADTNKKKAEDEGSLIPLRKQQLQAQAAEANARAKQIRQQGEAELGTPEQNAEMMVHGLVAPSQLSKRAKEYNAMLPLADAYSMKTLGKHFSPEDAEALYHSKQALIKDYADGKQADQIQSFNTFLGHAQNLSNSIAQLRNTNIPLLNTPLNKLRTMTGDPKVQAILPDIEAVRTEYQNFLNNNHALQQADIKEGHKMLDENASPAQMEAAIKSFAHTALIRTAALNDRYKRTIGTDVPDLLSEDSQNALKGYGLGDEAQRLLYSKPAAQPGAAAAQPAAGGAKTPPPGKFAVRDKTGQAVGYADDAKGTNYVPF